MRVPVSTSSSSAEATKGTRGTSLRSCSIFAALPSNGQARPSAPLPANLPFCPDGPGNYRLSLIFPAEKADSTKIEPRRALPVTQCRHRTCQQRPSDLKPATPAHAVVCVLTYPSLLAKPRLLGPPCPKKYVRIP